MPSITYIEDNGSDNDFNAEPKPNIQSAPEPPTRYDSNSMPPMPQNGSTHDSGYAEFASARRLVTAALVMALVSLVIGGVLLGTVSVIVAIIAFGKVRSNMLEDNGNQAWAALKRSATISIVVAVLALAANIAALIVIYPMVIEALQSGEYTSLLSGSAQTLNTGSNSSTWG